MAAGYADIEIEQNADFYMTIGIVNSDGTIPDVSAWTGKGQVRKTVTDGSVQCPLTISVVDGPGGILGAGAVAAVTKLIKIPAQSAPKRSIVKMAYDIDLVDGSGVQFRALEGIANVSPGSTQ